MSRSTSMATKRGWLEKFEKGTTETQLARVAKRDIRTIKKGMDDARRERVASQAKMELIKDAMRDHNKQLMAVLNELTAVLELSLSSVTIPWENQFVSGTIRMAGITAVYENLIMPYSISVTLNIEDKPEWELAKEHLKRDPLWPSLYQWKKALAAYLEAAIRLKLVLAGKLKEKTGYEFEKELSSGSFLYLHTVDFVFQMMVLKLPRLTDLDFKENLRIEKDKGDIKYANSTILAHAPGEEERSRKNILAAIAEAIESNEATEVVTAFRAVQDTTVKVKRTVNEILLTGLLPGQCRICSRIGL